MKDTTFYITDRKSAIRRGRTLMRGLGVAQAVLEKRVTVLRRRQDSAGRRASLTTLPERTERPRRTMIILES